MFWIRGLYFGTGLKAKILAQVVKTKVVALTKIGITKIKVDFFWMLTTFKQLGICELDLWWRMCLQKFGAQKICWSALTRLLCGDNGGSNTRKQIHGNLKREASTLTRTHLKNMVNTAFRGWSHYMIRMSTHRRSTSHSFQILRMMKPKNTSEVTIAILLTMTTLSLRNTINSNMIQIVSLSNARLAIWFCGIVAQFMEVWLAEAMRQDQTLSKKAT